MCAALRRCGRMMTMMKKSLQMFPTVGWCHTLQGECRARPFTPTPSPSPSPSRCLHASEARHPQLHDFRARASAGSMFLKRNWEVDQTDIIKKLDDMEARRCVHGAASELASSQATFRTGLAADSRGLFGWACSPRARVSPHRSARPVTSSPRSEVRARPRGEECWMLEELCHPSTSHMRCADLPILNHVLLPRTKGVVLLRKGCVVLDGRPPGSSPRAAGSRRASPRSTTRPSPTRAARSTL
jgi:hypothetical protein